MNTKTLPPLPPLPRKSRARRRDQADEPAAPVTTYSIRLTDKERLILEDALQVTGWTPTYFITRAAMDRAASVLNTRTPRSFDFAKAARRLATQLCDPEIKGWSDRDDSPVDLGRLSMEEGVSLSTDSLTEREVEQLSSANGGAEFFEMFLEECRRIVADRAKLPDPINPNKLV